MPIKSNVTNKSSAALANLAIAHNPLYADVSAIEAVTALTFLVGIIQVASMHFLWCLCQYMLVCF